jgi:hypothetical protein
MSLKILLRFLFVIAPLRLFFDFRLKVKPFPRVYRVVDTLGDLGDSILHTGSKI